MRLHLTFDASEVNFVADQFCLHMSRCDTSAFLKTSR
jgi:hypothetical protein